MAALAVGSTARLAVAQAPPATMPELDLVASTPPITVTAGVWLPRTIGDATLGSGPLANSIDLDTQLSLRDAEATAVADLDIWWSDRWQLHTDGFDFSVGGTTGFRGQSDFGSLRLEPGDLVRSDLDILSLGLQVHYAAWRPYEGHRRTSLSLGPILGLRYVDLDQKVEEIGVGAESTGGTWTGLHGGIQFVLEHDPDGGIPLVDRLELMAAVSVGPALGEDGGAMWDLRTGVSVFVNEHVAVLFGFRLIGMDVENGQFEFDGGLQGLSLAGRIRF